MKVERNDIDTLNACIAITIEPSDYKPKFESELKKHREKSQLKGFRKGKTPLSVIKKMYGQSVLAEAVNNALQQGLFDYIEKEKINILGDPLPNAEQEAINFDPNALSDFTFKFDIGISPALTVEGISEEDEYTFLKVKIGSDIIEEELSTARKRFGTQESIDANPEDKDILTISAFELEDGKRKEEGHECSFKVMVDLMNEDYQKEVKKMKQGDKFEFDINQIEKDKDEKYIRRYLLGLEEGDEKEVGSNFEGFIDDISRTIPSELNQEFFDKYMGEGKASNEDEIKNLIEEDIQKYYDHQSKSVMYREILDKLVEINAFDLPESFLKRWIKATNEGKTEEEIEKEFPDFLKNLRWTLIKSQIAKNNKVEVNAEEVKAKVTAQVRAYLGQYAMEESYINNMVERLMSDRNQVNKVYEEILADKVFAAVEEKIKTKEKKVSIDEFKDIVQAINQRLEAA